MAKPWIPHLSVAIAVFLSTVAAASLSGPAPVRDDLSEQDRLKVAEVTRLPEDFGSAQPFERMSAGAATSTRGVSPNAFSHPSANLPFADQQTFLLGNGLFRKDWVSAPSSTQASDGLGPLFNARACQSCHIKDGRGHAPAGPADEAVSLLVRLSVPPDEADTDAIEDGRLLAAPESVYGHQLQDHAVAGLAAEGKIRIDYESVEVALSGGETATLRKPMLSIGEAGYGPLRDDTRTSVRVAPPMIGLGLIEAIHEADIAVRNDPDDLDGDGISGRLHWTHDDMGNELVGRFGWKALVPTVRDQVALAFSGDMGLSTPIAPAHFGECTEAQARCRDMPDGAQAHLGDHEVPQEFFDLVVFYSENLAVPARRGADEPRVLAGKRAFHEAGCASCHVPSYVTRRDATSEAHRFQLIWPHTDLLLHDMGEGLADTHSEGDARGEEWRTPPLWGLGLASTVHEEATFLHDGRARTILEAVLWHGGEARPARDRVVQMAPADRADLIRFLESL